MVDTEARLVDLATGAVLAEATGVYVAAGEERKRQLRGTEVMATAQAKQVKRALAGNSY